MIQIFGLFFLIFFIYFIILFLQFGFVLFGLSFSKLVLVFNSITQYLTQCQTFSSVDVLVVNDLPFIFFPLIFNLVLDVQQNRRLVVNAFVFCIFFFYYLVFNLVLDIQQCRCFCFLYFFLFNYYFLINRGMTTTTVGY